MTDATNVLSQLSNALSARAAAARGAVVAIRISEDRHLTGTLWQSDVVVASEQSLPDGDEFDLVAPDGATINAKVAGRDPGSNVALLRLERALSPPELVGADAVVGTLALAVGADGAGGVTARLGIVNVAGPEWQSQAGGRIDKRIELDIRLARAEEGGPVFDAEGRCLGMSTFGVRTQVLVIPSATIARVVPQLLKEGRIARGWLGVGLQPVAIPDALQGAAGQPTGMMVMSIADNGPAAKAGLVAGDIVLSVNDAPTRRIRRLATQLGPDSIGTSANVRVIRGGAIVTLQAVIEARPAA